VAQAVEILFFGHGTIAVTWAALDPDVVRSITTPNWRLSYQGARK